tara:strand:- start:1196 stop:1408 length:213 start_codon:yes stop_codon:yes gene_type:complete
MIEQIGMFEPQDFEAVVCTPEEALVHINEIRRNLELKRNTDNSLIISNTDPKLTNIEIKLIRAGDNNVRG